MKKRLSVLLLIVAFLLSDKASASQYAFRITFHDKNNTPYSLSSPSAYLSSRSLLRRSTQGIPIDSTDIPVNRTYIDSVISLTGGIFHGSSRWLNTCVILLSDSTHILALSGKSFVKNVQVVAYYGSDLHHKNATITGGSGAPVIKNTKSKTTSFNATYYSSTWDQTQIVNGNVLHTRGFLGEGKLIAVFDAGFLNSNTNPGFDSLRSSGRIVDSFDFVLHGNTILRQDSHGASALSTIAGYWPGSYVGTAPKASFALYITEDNSLDQLIELDNLLFATERADSIGADIISESVGYDLFDFPAGAGQVFLTDLDGKTTVGAKAANFATQKGMLFVATAGNDGNPIPGWGNHILTPGDADSALTIGSTDVTGNPAPSSGYGPNAAGQIKPDVSTLGHPASILGATGVEASDGTSFSTPQIAGWAACIWQANPGATPFQIRQAIIKCASHYSSPGAQIGYGVPNFECTEQVLNLTELPHLYNNWVIASPNPFSNDLSIDVNPFEDGFLQIQVMDIIGRSVYTTYTFGYKNVHLPLSISLGDFSPGIYLLKVTGASQTTTLKVQKQ